MEITRKSQFTGNYNTMNLNITEEQLSEYENREFGKGRLIQDIFPNLKPDEREFLMTGVTKEEWDNMFGSEEEED